MGALVRKEFTVYFKNPTGWFTLCVYTLIAGICFVFSVINNNTTSMYTFFSLYLYIANLVFVSLLSFKFFSEEKKNGTDSSIIPAERTSALAVNSSGDIEIFAILRLSASSFFLNSFSRINRETNSEMSL